MSDTKILDEWVIDMELHQGRSPATVSRYLAHVARALKWMSNADIDPLKAAPEVLRAYVGTQLHQDGLAPRSRRAHISALKSFYVFASSRGLCGVNPAADLKSPYAGRPLPTVMGQDTLSKLLLACDLSTFKGLRDATIIGVLADTGVRASTLCALNESSLIWEHVESEELLTVRTVGKGDVEHMAPVGPEARLMLRAYMGHSRWLAPSLQLDNGDRPLFVNLASAIPGSDRQGERRRLTRKGLIHIIKRVGEAAGVPVAQCHPHAFRHMAGTAVYEATGDLKAVAEHLGHRSVNSAEIYSHLAMSRKRKIAAASSSLTKLDNIWTQLAQQERGARP
jgi:site-specific recombinase XerD